MFPSVLDGEGHPDRGSSSNDSLTFLKDDTHFATVWHEWQSPCRTFLRSPWICLASLPSFWRVAAWNKKGWVLSETSGPSTWRATAQRAGSFVGGWRSWVRGTQVLPVCARDLVTMLKSKSGQCPSSSCPSCGQVFSCQNLLNAPHCCDNVAVLGLQ